MANVDTIENLRVTSFMQSLISLEPVARALEYSILVWDRILHILTCTMLHCMQLPVLSSTNQYWSFKIFENHFCSQLAKIFNLV